ncbi:MAG: hypothetical protein Q4E36_01135 [Bacillota bacterium]|nr:hypothetical protein [Bacillota bacterium]
MKNNIYKNATFIVLSIIIAAYLLNFISYFNLFIDEFSETEVILFFYIIVFMLLLSNLAFIAFINGLNLSKKYYIYIAWIYLVLFTNIFRKNQLHYTITNIRLMEICAISLVVSILGFFQEKIRIKKFKN